MARKNQDNKEAAPVAPRVNTGYSEQGETRETRYVVLREGHRVSAQEYSSPSEPKALEEQKFWRKVATNHSWGEPVEIVKYDNKLHRVW